MSSISSNYRVTIKKVIIEIVARFAYISVSFLATGICAAWYEDSVFVENSLSGLENQDFPLSFVVPELPRDSVMIP